jgi:flagellar biosynthesis activator protein FlaF
MYAAQQLEAYRTVQKTTVSGREIEALVLIKAAVKLNEIRNNWDSPDRDAKLDEALRHNQRIWSIFQGELMKEDNPLPKKLRQDILSLSTFIDKRTFEVMACPAPEKLEVIINLNLNIAAGLRGQSEKGSRLN